MGSYLKHKKPVNEEPPKLLVNFFKSNTLTKGDLILDLACGYGRSPIYCESKGFKVIAVDYDEKIINGDWHKEKEIALLQVDCRNDLPFKENTFGLIIVIHFYAKGLFLRLKKLIKPSGFLVYESIGLRGENWRELELKDEVKNQLGNDFEFILYESKTQKVSNNIYESLKIIAKKIR
jgi:SAM-dependent methyltransferase